MLLSETCDHYSVSCLRFAVKLAIRVVDGARASCFVEPGVGQADGYAASPQPDSDSVPSSEARLPRVPQERSDHA